MPRMRAHAARRGYHITHLSRPVRYDDFFDFDWIVGMDDRNISKLKSLAPGLEEEKKVVRMTDYCRLKVVDHVPDPYYGGDSGFENVLDILEDACAGLLDTLRGAPLAGMQRVPHPFVIFGQSSFSCFFI